MGFTIDLSDKVAIVTGAGSGIGRATSLVLAQAGANVVIPDINIKGAEETARQIKKLGREAVPLQVDVTSASDAERMVRTTVEKFGKIDILVNNAGTNTSFRQPFYQQPEDDWMKIIQIDVKGLWLCSKATAPEMIKRRSGKIVNISSTAGVVAMRLQSNFVAAKAGVIRLTAAMALELAPYKINVNCIAPGSTATEGLKALMSSDPTWKRNQMKVIPLGRAAEPKEIGFAVLFLVSELADYITGQTLVVDGGWTAQDRTF